MPKHYFVTVRCDSQHLWIQQLSISKVKKPINSYFLTIAVGCWRSLARVALKRDCGIVVPKNKITVFTETRVATNRNRNQSLLYCGSGCVYSSCVYRKDKLSFQKQNVEQSCYKLIILQSAICTHERLSNIVTLFDGKGLANM